MINRFDKKYKIISLIILIIVVLISIQLLNTYNSDIKNTDNPTIYDTADNSNIVGSDTVGDSKIDKINYTIRLYNDKYNKGDINFSDVIIEYNNSNINFENEIKDNNIKYTGKYDGYINYEHIDDAYLTYKITDENLEISEDQSIDIKIYNTQDNKYINRKINIPKNIEPNESYIIDSTS